LFVDAIGIAVNGGPQIQRENKYRCGLRTIYDKTKRTTERSQPLDNQTVRIIWRQ
jgi:hypothetical protein